MTSNKGENDLTLIDKTKEEMTRSKMTVYKKENYLASNGFFGSTTGESREKEKKRSHSISFFIPKKTFTRKKMQFTKEGSLRKVTGRKESSLLGRFPRKGYPRIRKFTNTE